MAAAMPRMQSWAIRDVGLIFLMWTVMMIAMMTPSAAPMILMFASVQRRRREGRSPYVSTGVFLSGYLLVWAFFSALAALAQWGLHSAALLSPMMMTTSAALGGALLAGAGIFQWTPLKQACLTRCRSPFDFIMTEWREGTGGAVAMGLRHGLICAGCCWMLMAILFVAGVMNLVWVAVIAAFVFAEKLLPRGRWVSRHSGAALVVWGAWLALAPMAGGI